MAMDAVWVKQDTGKHTPGQPPPTVAGDFIVSKSADVGVVVVAVVLFL